MPRLQKEDDHGGEDEQHDDDHLEDEDLARDAAHAQRESRAPPRRVGGLASLVLCVVLTSVTRALAPTWSAKTHGSGHTPMEACRPAIE
ncbi:hypothetical protein GCM10012280_48410 [Wenjunlia tyrosinilytica]|uniref:Uncharacterized protein n=1 Tax=Wenjunlia tyrosinilytica TaxID=1544741 RepID=A0A917ZU89_9ACTN|nr:hypothetical protein GCM10012280_48410 [Wenjunlia tyrosinilytica]